MSEEETQARKALAQFQDDNPLWPCVMESDWAQWLSVAFAALDEARECEAAALVARDEAQAELARVNDLAGELVGIAEADRDEARALLAQRDEAIRGALHELARPGPANSIRRAAAAREILLAALRGEEPS